MGTLQEYCRWVLQRQFIFRDIRLSSEGMLRYWLLRARYRHLKVAPFFLHRRCEFFVGKNAQISFGHFVRFMQDFTGHFYGNLTIGNNVFFNRGCYLSVYESISIGNNCIFGEYVSLHDEDHIAGWDSRPFSERGYHTAPIVIGNNVWVGAKATILKGVQIGDNAVIGANAVVTHNIPAYRVAAGIPARIISEIAS